MDPIRTIKLRWVFGVPGDINYQLSRFRFSPRTQHSWQPAINAYRCDESVRICVDLAGVRRSDIELAVETKRVIIRGARDVPEPTNVEERTVQMLTMEIDYGPFERTIGLPQEVDVEKAHADLRDGLLWIYLPLKS